MIFAITVWLLIGAGVNMYLHLRNVDQISSIVTSGYLGVMAVMLAGMLNHFIWPISLYLDSKHNKK